MFQATRTSRTEPSKARICLEYLKKSKETSVLKLSGS